MPELKLWGCDRCSSQSAAPELPDGWVQAHVGPPENRRPDTFDRGSNKRYIWCAKCWDLIQTPPPTNINTTYTLQT